MTRTLNRQLTALAMLLWCGASPNEAQAWPKGVPYPKKVTARVSLPTPRQRFQGYDRQVIIATGVEGIGIGNVKFHFSRNGKKGVIPLAVVRDFAYSKSRNQAIMPLKLAFVPASLGELTLSADVFLADYSWDSRPGARYKKSASGERIRIPDPIDNIKIVVRRAGQKIKSPQVSTLRPFRLGLTQLRSINTFPNTSRPSSLLPRLTSVGRHTGATVLVTLRDAKGQLRQPKGRVNFDNVRLITAKGDVHPLMDGKHGQIIGMLFSDADVKTDEPISYQFGCNLTHIPLSQGKITFQAAVSVDDCWPIPISVRVR